MGGLIQQAESHHLSKPLPSTIASPFSKPGSCRQGCDGKNVQGSETRRANEKIKHTANYSYSTAYPSIVPNHPGLLQLSVDNHRWFTALGKPATWICIRLQLALNIAHAHINQHIQLHLAQRPRLSFWLQQKQAITTTSASLWLLFTHHFQVQSTLCPHSNPMMWSLCLQLCCWRTEAEGCFFVTSFHYIPWLCPNGDILTH